MTPEESEILEKIKTCPDLFENPILMECTSTIVYLLKHYPDLRDDEILTMIKQLKPYLSEYTCIAGLTKAKELLFKEEYLTGDLKREIDLWERIDD